MATFSQTKQRQMSLLYMIQIVLMSMLPNLISISNQKWRSYWNLNL